MTVREICFSSVLCLTFASRSLAWPNAQYKRRLQLSENNEGQSPNPKRPCMNRGLYCDTDNQQVFAGTSNQSIDSTTPYKPKFMGTQRQPTYRTIEKSKHGANPPLATSHADNVMMIDDMEQASRADIYSDRTDLYSMLDIWVSFWENNRKMSEKAKYSQDRTKSSISATYRKKTVTLDDVTSGIQIDKDLHRRKAPDVCNKGANIDSDGDTVGKTDIVNIDRQVDNFNYPGFFSSSRNIAGSNFYADTEEHCDDSNDASNARNLHFVTDSSDEEDLTLIPLSKKFFDVLKSFDSYAIIYFEKENQDMLNKENEKVDCGNIIIPMANHSDAGFSHTINLDKAHIKLFVYELSGENLYGKTEYLLRENINEIHTDAEYIIWESKHSEGIYKYIINLNIESYNRAQMRDLYYLFVVYKCLDYHDNLCCYVLKESLWDIHVYIAEFSSYVLWKLAQLNLDRNRAFDKNLELKYKTHLKEELKILCVILDLYDEMLKLGKKSDVYAKQLELMLYAVLKFRTQVFSYLESFHELDPSAVFYYLAVKMEDHNIYKNLRPKQQMTKLTNSMLEYLDQIAPDTINQSARAQNTNVEPIISHYHNTLSLCDLKNMLLVLAFTVKFPIDKLITHNLSDVKDLLRISSERIEPSVILYNYIMKLSSNLPFVVSAVVRNLYFLNVVRKNSTSRKKPKQGVDDSRIFKTREMIEQEIEEIRKHPVGIRFVIYYNLMREAMGIDVVID